MSSAEKNANGGLSAPPADPDHQSSFPDPPQAADDNDAPRPSAAENAAPSAVLPQQPASPPAGNNSTTASLALDGHVNGDGIPRSKNVVIREERAAVRRTRPRPSIRVNPDIIDPKDAFTSSLLQAQRASDGHSNRDSDSNTEGVASDRPHELWTKLSNWVRSGETAQHDANNILTTGSSSSSANKRPLPNLSTSSLFILGEDRESSPHDGHSPAPSFMVKTSSAGSWDASGNSLMSGSVASGSRKNAPIPTASTLFADMVKDAQQEKEQRVKSDAEGNKAAPPEKGASPGGLRSASASSSVASSGRKASKISPTGGNKKIAEKKNATKSGGSVSSPKSGGSINSAGNGINSPGSQGSLAGAVQSQSQSKKKTGSSSSSSSLAGIQANGTRSPLSPKPKAPLPKDPEQQKAPTSSDDAVAPATTSVETQPFRSFVDSEESGVSDLDRENGGELGRGWLIRTIYRFQTVGFKSVSQSEDDLRSPCHSVCLDRNSGLVVHGPESAGPMLVYYREVVGSCLRSVRFFLR